MTGDGITFSIRHWLVQVMLAGALCCVTADAVDVRLIGEKISFVARDASLQDVLEGLTRAGVRVRMDPSIQARVHAVVRNEPVESVLRNILEPFGYVLIWDVIKGPVGDYPKLAEIQVFPVGDPEKATLVRAPAENFEVVRGPHGREPAFVPNEILIGFRPGTRRDEFEKLIWEIGGSVLECAKGVGVYRISLPPGVNVLDLVSQLNRHPIVTRAEPNYVSEILLPVATRAAFLGDVKGAERLARTTRSSVAILDSGLLSLAALDGWVKAGWDAVVPSRELSDPVGHGTQMALIASGMAVPRGSVSESEPIGVPLVVVRAFDDHGRTSSFTLMRAIEYALEKGARVINMSWGSATASEFLEAAIQKAVMGGAVVVAAAGNEPTGAPIYPAGYPGVVAVSALDQDGNLWQHSNTGQFVMFAAPGVADLPVGYQGAPGRYVGTSIASAYVARTLAIYFDRHPQSTARDAIAALKRIARDAGAPGRDAQYGFGVIDELALRQLVYSAE